MTLSAARVALIGSGRMGQIRASLMYANPRFDLCGIIDNNIDAATSLASKYKVRNSNYSNVFNLSLFDDNRS